MATYHSVKDAVKLFDAGFTGGKQEQQGVFVEEKNPIFWNEEVNNLKDKIKNAEKTKIEALLELEEAKKTVERLNHKLRNEKVLDLSSNVRDVTTELGFAKESLQRVAEEESEICTLVESLKLELENVKREHSQLKENERRAIDQEVEDAKTELLTLEEELNIALLQAKAAKEMEKVSVDHGLLSETEALRACRDETLKKLEMSEREMVDITALTQDALKKADMVREVTIVMDKELKRRRKTASKNFAKTKMFAKSFPSTKEMNKSRQRSSASKDTCLVKC